MTNPKEDLLEIRDFIVLAATKFALEVHGRLQVRYFITDTLDEQINIRITPVINRYPWPKELINKIRNPPLGKVEHGSDGVMNGTSICYCVPFSVLPVEFISRREEAISADQRRISAHNKMYKWTHIKHHLSECVKGIEGNEVISVSSVLAAINDTLIPVQAEIVKIGTEIKAMDKVKMESNNEHLLRDIAKHLGIEESPDLDIYFKVKDYKYPIPFRSVPHDPS